MNRSATSTQRLRIVVLGLLVRWPIGGMAWHYLQYVLGLSALGHDVCFVEDSDSYPSCWNPVGGIMTTDPRYGLEFTAHTFERMGLGSRWAYYDEHNSRWIGPAAGRITETCETADIVLNISGVNRLRALIERIPVRVLIDTDPGFTQIRHCTDSDARALAAQHNRHFSFAGNLAADAARLPDDGIAWLPTRQPVFLDAWNVSRGPEDGEFRTIMQWDSYPPLTHHGIEYGMKSRSFADYVDLPTQTAARLGIAATRLPELSRRQLEAAGWRIHDPDQVSRDPWTYQDYICASKGEFTVAKHGYSISNCGWFSERSACYLASGRPVVAQETGYSTWLPTGMGLWSFQTPAEAIEGLEEISTNYEKHCRAAREVATESFDSGRVLTALLEEAFSAHSSAVGNDVGGHEDAPVGGRSR